MLKAKPYRHPQPLFKGMCSEAFSGKYVKTEQILQVSLSATGALTLELEEPVSDSSNQGESLSYITSTIKFLMDPDTIQ